MTLGPRSKILKKKNFLRLMLNLYYQADVWLQHFPQIICAVRISVRLDLLYRFFFFYHFDNIKRKNVKKSRKEIQKKFVSCEFWRKLMP